MKLCEFCAGNEATKEKTTYGITVYLCDNCFEGENTMVESDFDEMLKPCYRFNPKKESDNGQS